MISGSGPGAGKSTLARRLEREFARSGRKVRVWPESALFEWTELADLADRFRRRDYPTADHLLDAFERVAGATAADTVWVQDWSWPDLAEDLPWAAELDALCAFSARMRAAAARLRPIVLYLAADIETGLERAVRQRGQAWLARTHRALVGGEPDGHALTRLAACYAVRERRIRQSLVAGGWPLIELPVMGSAELVFANTGTLAL